MRSITICLTALLLVSSAPALGSDRLVVHEWGTFTALQDEQGRAIAGINTDDEPLPSFVHELNQDLVQGSTEMPTVYFKGTPRVHPDVIVRLETPVLYFYPPAGQRGAMNVNVDVAFRGGWLTQFYPDAKVDAPGVSNQRFQFGALEPRTVGTLAWHDLKVGGDAPGPETTSPAWLAPRKVPGAASVRTAGGETERYLFYRGVGNVAAPLCVSRDPRTQELRIDAQFANAPIPDAARIGPLWLVDVGDDGRLAFRTAEPAPLPGRDDALATLPATFPPGEYGDHLASLRKSMHAALVADGLYADEADALLNTWETSYFKRPGLRLFFLVPRQWTDYVLPLHVGSDGMAVDVSRVMVGRIELVTPRDRALLRRIAAGPVSDPRWVHEAMVKFNAGRDDYFREAWYQQLMDGTRSLQSMHLEMPADYRAYLELGRFRNALILDELKRQPSDTLSKFIQVYGLQAHQTHTGVAE